MAFECKHGTILYGSTCLNCEREKRAEAEEKREREEAIKKILARAEKLDW